MISFYLRDMEASTVIKPSLNCFEQDDPRLIEEVKVKTNSAFKKKLKLALTY